MTFFKQISNYIVFFIIFGLWTTWRNSKYFWLLQIYSCTLIIAAFVLNFASVLMDEFSESLSLSSTISTLSLITILLTHLVIVIETPCKSIAQVLLIEKFTNVDRTFHTGLSVSIPYRKEMRKLFSHTFLLISVVFITTTTIWANSIYLHQTNNFMYSCMYSSCIMRLRLIQVLFFVYLVRSRLIWINRELIDIRNVSDTNQFDNENVDDKLTVYGRLIHFKQVYGELYEICQLINTIFGWSLLALFIQSFSDFTSNGYWLYLLLDENTTIEFNIYTVVICVFWLVLNVTILAPLTYFCASCSQHVRPCASY